LLGTTAAEGINGTSGDDVFIGGGGGDVINGGNGSDIYVYGKRDGNLWVKDDGNGPTDNDKLVRALPLDAFGASSKGCYFFISNLRLHFPESTLW